MEARGSAHKLDYARDEHDSWAQFWAGSMNENHASREKYWRAWCDYAGGMGCRPFLDGPGDRPDEAIMGFAARVQRGFYGRGRTVRVQTVKKALAVVSQMFDMDQTHRHQNPVNVGGKRMRKLAIQLDGIRAGDRPPARKLAVPVDTIDWMWGNLTKNALQQAVAWLFNTAFFYLLRVREYTVMAQK